MVFVTILLTVLVFSALILVHELGHYITARIFDVHILEFSIGMGPTIYSHKSKKTDILYSVRLLPIGGYVQMVGENGEEEVDSALQKKYDLTPSGKSADPNANAALEIEEKEEKEGKEGKESKEDGAPSKPQEDPRALSKKPIWQRMIIIAAGGLTNIIIGLILTVVMVATMNGIGGTVVAEFKEGAVSQKYGLKENDIILKVNNTHVNTHMFLAYSIMYYGNEPIDLTVVRNADIEYNDNGEMTGYSGGEKIELKDVVFAIETMDEEQGGVAYGVVDFQVYRVEKNFASVISQSFEYGVMMIKTVWDSLHDLIVGKYGIEAFSSPVGISGEIGNAAKNGATSFLYLVVLLSINLGIINLLPIPALDGGHLLFYVIELIRGKPISASLRAKINGIALTLIFGFALFIMFKDIVNLFI